MGNIFVCADLHILYKNIIKYENRPYANTDEMDKALIKNWNSVVKADDKVFVLGDVAFTSKAKTIELVRQLNGRKTLIMGNHDRGRSVKFWQDAGFELVSPHPIVYGGKYILSHEPFEKSSEDFFYIHGHVHSSEEYDDWNNRAACVSIERLNYQPARFEDVISGKAYKHRKRQRNELPIGNTHENCLCLRS